MTIQILVVSGLMVLAILLLMAMLARLYRKAGPHQALVVYGMRGTRVIKGGGTVIWPMFETYQREQGVILDAQLKGIQDFIEKFDTLDDATAMKLIKSHFGRDSEMAALRSKWLGEFQKVVGTKLAVRAMQIDRRVSLAQQLQLTTKIPLAQ